MGVTDPGAQRDGALHVLKDVLSASVSRALLCA